MSPRYVAIVLAAGVLAACQPGGTQVASGPSTIRFSPPECDFAVSFVERPELGVNDDGTRYIAVATTGAASDRTVYYAECVNEAAVGPARAAELLASLARAEGLGSVEAFDVDTPVGPGFALTGSSVIASVPYEHQYVVVPGSMTAMVYGVASPAASFSSPVVAAYLQSIERQ